MLGGRIRLFCERRGYKELSTARNAKQPIRRLPDVNLPPRNRNAKRIMT